MLTLKSRNLRETAMKKVIVTEKTIKRIMFTLAVAAALMLALASGVPSVPTKSTRALMYSVIMGALRPFRVPARLISKAAQPLNSQ
jgi:hypothetical protein